MPTTTEGIAATRLSAEPLCRIWHNEAFLRNNGCWFADATFRQHSSAVQSRACLRSAVMAMAAITKMASVAKNSRD